MTRKEALAELIERVQAGDNLSRAEWGEVFPDTPDDDDYPRSMMATSACLGWIDAARALHEAVLSEWRVLQIRQMRDWAVRLERFTRLHPDHKITKGKHPDDPARAWLLAILRALHSMEPDT